VLLLLESQKSLLPNLLEPHPIGWFLCPSCNSRHLVHSPPPLPGSLSRLLQVIQSKVNTISRRQDRRSASRGGEEQAGYVSRDGALWEEIKLEQQKKELEQLLSSLQRSLDIEDKTQKKNYRSSASSETRFIPENHMHQLSKILARLESLTSLLSPRHIKTPPNSLSPSASLSYLVVSMPLYEAVLCSLPLFLSSPASSSSPIPPHLLSHPLSISAEATYQDNKTVQVSVLLDDIQECRLEMKPSKAGILRISVLLNGENIRGSPYRVKVNALSLQETENTDQNSLIKRENHYVMV